MKKFFRRLGFILLIILISSGSSQAVTKYQFLTGLLEARGIDWTSSPEYAYEDPGGFMLNSGYISEYVSNLDANVTRREALRWCIESLGLDFEAELLSDYPSGFSDAKSLNEFERGCLVVATNMRPALFTKDKNFRGKNNLTQQEFSAILERVRTASRSLVLDMIRNPEQGLQVHIHREGVPTGIPSSWRVYAFGIKNKSAAETFRNSLRASGYDASFANTGGAYGVRAQKIEEYEKVVRFLNVAQARGFKTRVIPSMTNTNMRIVPKFWVMVTIDPTHWKIRPIASRNGANELRTLSVIASQNGSQAAINAGFFATSKGGKGYPIGALRVNGRNINSPQDNRGILGWNDYDEAYFAVSPYSEAEGEERNDYWQEMSQVVQAGPLLIDEGNPVRHDEGFQNGFISARHPRSAVGLTRNGEWVFMIIDGRNGMHSSGATISELTEILRGQNVTHALNLDGGGSTELIIGGRIYNVPSDGYERNISYGLGVLPLR